MKILAFDTSTQRLFVTLTDNERMLASRALHDSSTHMKNLLPTVDEILSEAGMKKSELEAVAVSVGPGSYTGIRIGVSQAQALGFALGIPCIPLNTLDLFADSNKRVGRLLLSMLDARNRRVYAKAFLGDLEILETQVGNLDQICEALVARGITAEEIVLCGDEKVLAYAGDKALEKIFSVPVEAVSHPYYTLDTLATAAQRSEILIEPTNLYPAYYQATEAERNFDYYVD